MTECSKGILRAQEVKSAVESNDSVVEDIYNIVKQGFIQDFRVGGRNKMRA